MLRLKRHIVTEIIEVFFAVIVALILIMVSFQLAKLLSQAAQGKITGSAIFQLVALQAVNLFVLLTPFAFFIAMLVALTRLSNTNELVAMKAVGFSQWQIHQALLFIALPLAGLIVFMTLQVLPQLLTLNYTLLHKAKKESELSIIQPGQFRRIGGNTTVFVADLNNQQFSKFFIWQSNNGTESIMVAEYGEQQEHQNERHIALQNGSRYSIAADGSSQLLFFERLLALLPEIAPKTRSEKLKSKPTAELLRNPTLAHRIELQRRISPAISILLLVLCAPLLVNVNPRENRYGKFVAAILIYAIYSNAQVIFQTLTEKHYLPVFLGIYTSHLVFLSLCLLWLWHKNQHWRSLFRQWRGQHV